MVLGVSQKRDMKDSLGEDTAEGESRSQARALTGKRGLTW